MYPESKTEHAVLRHDPLLLVVKAIGLLLAPVRTMMMMMMMMIIMMIMMMVMMYSADVFCSSFMALGNCSRM